MIYQAYSPEGYDPLYPYWYGEFIRLSEEGRFKPAVRSDAMIVSGFGREDFARNFFRQQILRSLAVGFILDRVENQSDETTFPPEEYSLIWKDQGWRLYQNKQAAPLVFLAQKVYYSSSKEDFEKIFFNPSFSPAKDCLLYTSPSPRD